MIDRDLVHGKRVVGRDHDLADARLADQVAHRFPGADSPLEGNGFEPSVPRCACTVDSAAMV